MEYVFDLDDLDQMAAEVLNQARQKKIIALHGDMGVGKTTLVRSICRALNVPDNVSSPTFSLINEYHSEEGIPVFHIDLYRLADVREADMAGVREILDSGCHCFVEWPEKAPELFDNDTLHIHLFTLADNVRKLQIN